MASAVVHQTNHMIEAVFEDDLLFGDALDAIFDGLARLEKRAQLPPVIKSIYDAVYGLSDEDRFDLALSHSICPVHYVDYAICFADEDPECAEVRAQHPEHDT